MFAAELCLKFSTLVGPKVGICCKLPVGKERVNAALTNILPSFGEYEGVASVHIENTRSFTVLLR